MDSNTYLQQIYDLRFAQTKRYRKRVWSVLGGEFFARLIPPDSAILDLGCGYGDFINHVTAAKKFAMDLNSVAAEHLDSEVRFCHQNCSDPWNIDEASLDVVFTSNFLEHLSDKTAVAETLAHAFSALRRGGRLIALGPNLKYVGGAYWDFFDHNVALTDLSLLEALNLVGFRVERRIPRFLPYTMQAKREYPLTLLRLYLRLPFIWPIFGKQFLLIARK